MSVGFQTSLTFNYQFIYCFPLSHPLAHVGNYFAYLKNTASGKKKNYRMIFFIDEVRRVTKHAAIVHRL